MVRGCRRHHHSVSIATATTKLADGALGRGPRLLPVTWVHEGPCLRGSPVLRRAKWWMGPAPAFSLKRACLNSQIIPQIRSRFRQASGGVIWNIFCPVKDEQGWELPQKGFGTLRHRLFPHCERLASGHCITSETRVTDRSGARFKGFFFLFLLFFTVLDL